MPFTDCSGLISQGTIRFTKLINERRDNKPNVEAQVFRLSNTSETDDNGSAMLQSFLSKLFKREIG